MARHLFIGNGGAATISNGLAADTGIALQADDHAAFAASSETVKTSPRFRVLQGTAGANIASPWISGHNIISVTGSAYVAPSAYTVTDTVAGTADNAGTLELKFIWKNAPSPTFFNLSIATAAEAHTAADATIKAAYEAAILPDWLNPTCNASDPDVLVFSGALRGDVAQGGNVWEFEPAVIDLIVVSFDGGTQTHTASATAGATGNGSGQQIVKLEEELRGVQYGYYDRLKLPNTPALTAVAANTYDTIRIVATKDGSTTSAINGVDNLIDVTIAMKVIASDALLDALHTALNSYTGSVGFLAVTAGS